MAVAEIERPRVLYRRPIDFPPLEPFEIPPNVRSLSRYVHDVAIPRGDLRRGQLEALNETVQAFQRGERVGYVEQVSGYGKSRYMQEISAGFGDQQVYIVPGERASTNIFDKYGGREVGRIDKDHKEFGCQITIITMPSLQSLHRALQRGDTSRINDARFIFGADLIFADEIHHYLTQQGLGILATFLYINPRSFMIGASATAGYDDIKHAEKQFGKPLHKVDIAEGVEEEVLISPHVRYVKTGVSLDGLRLTPEGDFVIDATVPLKEWDKKLLETYLRTCDEEGKQLRTISYLSNVERAHDFAELAESMGIPAEVVVGETRNRSEIYDRLEGGRLATVATVNTAIESIDLPWLEGTLHSAQTRSNRVAHQMFPRSMRNFPGKQEPWIIQVVAENTSFRRRPLLASDILGETRFVNGSVVRPRKPNEHQVNVPQATHRRTDITLPEGAKVDVEIIDINSLFRMSLLDRAELLGKGLLPPAEVEKFRAEINDFLARVYKGEPLPSFSNDYIANVLKLYDDVTGVDVSLQNIITRTLGTSRVNFGVSNGNIFKEFLVTGKLSQAEDIQNAQDNRELEVMLSLVSPETVPTEKELQRREFRELCDRFRSGEITKEEERDLSLTVYEILRGVDARDFRAASMLESVRINHSKFEGTVRLLSKLLGFNTSLGAYVSASHTRLIEFADRYVEESLMTRVNKSSSKPVEMQLALPIHLTQRTKTLRLLPPLTEEELRRRDFRSLCIKFRTGQASEEDEKTMSLVIGEILEGISDRLSEPLVLLGATQIEHPAFNARIQSLTRLLGFDNGSFSNKSMDKLLDLANKYRGEKPLKRSNDISQRQSRIEQRGEHSLLSPDDAKKILRGAFRSAREQGFNIKNLYEVASYQVFDDRFEGTLATFMAKVVGKRNSQQVRTADLHKALEMAGIEE